MGETLNRVGRIIQRKIAPWYGASNFKPGLDRILQDQTTLDALRQAGALNDDQEVSLRGVVDKNKVTDPNIDVNKLINLGSGPIKKLQETIKRTPDGEAISEDWAALEYARQLAEEAEAQARIDKNRAAVRSVRRGVLIGISGVVSLGLLKLAYENLPNLSVLQSQSAPQPKPALTPVLLVPTVRTPLQAPSTTLPDCRDKLADTPFPSLPNTIKRGPSVRPTYQGADLVRSEQEAWFRVLGVKVEIEKPNLLSEVARARLSGSGLDLIYLPKLDIGTLDDLKTLGELKYLAEMQNRYPNWKWFENLSKAEQGDPKISRNLNEQFWRWVRRENVDFPKLPGQWVAVENVPKPSYAESYAEEFLSKALSLNPYRFYTTWEEVQAAVNREKSKLYRDLLLEDKADLRMLEVLEWNLIANRKGWGATDTFEFTNTQLRRDDHDSLIMRGCLPQDQRMVVGDLKGGGAAYATANPVNMRVGNVAFRLAFYL